MCHTSHSLSSSGESLGTLGKHEVATAGWIKLDNGFCLKPRAGRVIVKIDKFEHKGKIIIPDRAQVPPTTGIVMGFGAGLEDIAVGDRVVFGVYSGTLLKFKNQPVVRVLSPEEILATVSGDADLEDTGA